MQAADLATRDSTSQCLHVYRALIIYLQWRGAPRNHNIYGDSSTIELMMHFVNLAEYIFA